jgi:predicted metal-dependent phosphoesterase TrpH
MKQGGIKTIEKWVKLGKADLHIHSNFSDGRPTVEEILEYVEKETDLDIIAISDHDTMAGAFLAQELMKEKHYRFELVLAEEITSQEGHILGLFLKEAVPPGLPAQEVVEKIQAQGGLAIAVHPFQRTLFQNPNMPTMDGVGLTTLLKLGWKFDAIEVVNATPTLYNENLRAQFLNKTILFRAETGASDAHILEAIGMGYTIFEGKTASELRYALDHHQTRAMYADWTLMALLKYFYFFIPKGLRIIWYTLWHGKKKETQNQTQSNESPK